MPFFFPEPVTDATTAADTTETTTSVYTVGMVVQSVLGAAMIALMITAVLGLMSALYPGSLDRIFRRRPSVAFRDALLLAGLVFVAGKSFDHVGTLLSHHFARFGSAPGPPSVIGLESALPFWSGLTGALAAVKLHGSHKAPYKQTIVTQRQRQNMLNIHLYFVPRVQQMIGCFVAWRQCQQRAVISNLVRPAACAHHLPRDAGVAREVRVHRTCNTLVYYFSTRLHPSPSL